MHDQPKYKPLRASEFFGDRQQSRQPVAGTVARGSLNNDAFAPASVRGAAGADGFPFPITDEILARGEERFNISCSPCHGRSGHGDGMIVRRGFPAPPSYHIDRLRAAPNSHFYDVITSGFGRMWSYADQVSPRDRWMIIAYIRALQLSQNAAVTDVPEDKRRQLGSGGQTR
ncbi:MAG TPA: cytochrome c [Blastocatellia bacterium]|nr:cytochrome c [Blastocatellia bacterium]